MVLQRREDLDDDGDRDDQQPGDGIELAPEEDQDRRAPFGAGARAASRN
ncbi:MAG TPA: hypothetical protein VMO26_18650 [Vicinamibacterales bacterium]|nr:hypothetical protein [Vicinamibacterales bacterium]